MLHGSSWDLCLSPAAAAVHRSPANPLRVPTPGPMLTMAVQWKAPNGELKSRFLPRSSNINCTDILPPDHGGDERIAQTLSKAIVLVINCRPSFPPTACYLDPLLRLAVSVSLLATFAFSLAGFSITRYLSSRWSIPGDRDWWWSTTQRRGRGSRTSHCAWSLSPK